MTAFLTFWPSAASAVCFIFSRMNEPIWTGVNRCVSPLSFTSYSILSPSMISLNGQCNQLRSIDLSVGLRPMTRFKSKIVFFAFVSACRRGARLCVLAQIIWEGEKFVKLKTYQCSCHSTNVSTVFGERHNWRHTSFTFTVLKNIWPVVAVHGHARIRRCPDQCRLPVALAW